MPDCLGKEQEDLLPALVQLCPAGQSPHAVYLSAKVNVLLGHVILNSFMGAISIFCELLQVVSPMSEYLLLVQSEEEPPEHDLPAGQGAQPILL